MNQYTITIETTSRETLTPAHVDALYDALNAYHPAFAVTARGWVAVTLTFAADTLIQATTTAIAVTEATTGATALTLTAMTEAEADARQGVQHVPDLISGPEAASMLGVTQQRVRQMIAEGKLGAHRIGERSYALVRSEVEARAHHDSEKP